MQGGSGGSGAAAEFIPFFRLHDSRYTVYWPQSTPGEQQPEADHFFKGKGGGRDRNRDRERTEKVETKAQAFYSRDLPLPAALVREAGGKLEISLAAKEKSMTASLYDLRLLR